MMKVTGEGSEGIVLDVEAGDRVLLPLNADERTAAFEVLTDALASLSGIMLYDVRAADQD
jgi:hypothetical protein